MWIKIVQEPSTKEKEWSQMSIMRPEFLFILYDSVWKHLKGFLSTHGYMDVSLCGNWRILKINLWNVSKYTLKI